MFLFSAQPELVVHRHDVRFHGQMRLRQVGHPLVELRVTAGNADLGVQPIERLSVGCEHDVVLSSTLQLNRQDFDSFVLLSENDLRSLLKISRVVLWCTRVVGFGSALVRVDLEVHEPLVVRLEELTT